MNKVQLPPNEVLFGNDVTVHEPAVPAFIKNSAFFTKSSGMRQVPELLLIEFFREICFESYRPKDEKQARELAPSSSTGDAERILLFIARGRSKRTKGIVKTKPYFGPLYPGLVRNAWARKEAERIISTQFIGGPLVQFLNRSGGDVADYAATVVAALYGRVRSSDGYTDIFKEIALKIPSTADDSAPISLADATLKLAGRLRGNPDDSLCGDELDKLSMTIGSDFYNLCKIEGLVPRLVWIDLLKSFLRLAMPSWLLAQMRLTVYLRDWTLAAFGGNVVDQTEINAAISGRWHGIFHPTQTGSNEVTLHVEGYVKARVELSILGYLVKHAIGLDSISGVLTGGSMGSGKVTIPSWLVSARTAGEAFGLAGTQAEVRAKIIPYAQDWGAWLNPRENGQGKNIEEFLRILLRLSRTDDDDGYILTSTVKGGFEKAVLFPGPAMLKLALILAAARKRVGGQAGIATKLVLSDLETQFADYGIDFAASAGARPQLISELSRLGFLKGSPDAGDSAELVAPIVGTAN